MTWDIINSHQNTDVFGVNDQNLRNLILDIYDCRDKLSKILEDAELIVQSTENFYKTSDGEEFRNMFKKLTSFFPVFLTNIQSYGEDLEVVLTKYKQNDTKGVDIFSK